MRSSSAIAVIAAVVRTCAPVSCGPNQVASMATVSRRPGLRASCAEKAEVLGSSTSLASIAANAISVLALATSMCWVMKWSCQSPRSAAPKNQAANAPSSSSGKGPTKSWASSAIAITTPLGAVARTQTSFAPIPATREQVTIRGSLSKRLVNSLMRSIVSNAGSPITRN